MAESPHEWFRPRLISLISEAESAGMARDVSVAVITDLVNGPLSADVPLPTGDNPNQDIGEPDSMAAAESGVHPSVPDYPVDTGGIGQGGIHIGHRRNW